MNLGEDLSDAFLALIRGDVTDLQEVLNRRGDGFIPEVGVMGSAVGTAAGGAAGAIAGKLGALGVKPHVQKVSDIIVQKYGIKTVYGYSNVGSVPDSDHPKRLAVDWMVSAKTDKAKGDAIAADLLANKSAWKVKYVIWNKQINSGSGWRTYTGPRDHTDHVHGSFEDA
jgi:hypothetical protein